MLKGKGANLDFTEKCIIFVVPTEQAADFPDLLLFYGLTTRRTTRELGKITKEIEKTTQEIVLFFSCVVFPTRSSVHFDGEAV